MGGISVTTLLVNLFPPKYSDPIIVSPPLTHCIFQIALFIIATRNYWESGRVGWRYETFVWTQIFIAYPPIHFEHDDLT